MLFMWLTLTGCGVGIIRKINAMVGYTPIVSLLWTPPFNLTCRWAHLICFLHLNLLLCSAVVVVCELPWPALERLRAWLVEWRRPSKGPSITVSCTLLVFGFPTCIFFCTSIHFNLHPTHPSVHRKLPSLASKDDLVQALCMTPHVILLKLGRTIHHPNTRLNRTWSIAKPSKHELLHKSS